MRNNVISMGDAIRLVTTKNVNFLSSPSTDKPDPNGLWTVIAVIGTDVLCNKGDVLIKIPITDIVKVFEYDGDSLIDAAMKVKDYYVKKQHE